MIALHCIALHVFLSLCERKIEKISETFLRRLNLTIYKNSLKSLKLANANANLVELSVYDVIKDIYIN